MDTQAQTTSNQNKRVQDSETVANASSPNDNAKQPPLKKKKTKKITISKELAEKRKANLKTRFNSLPKNLKFRILLRLDSYDLLEMKEVCSHWYHIIKQLLEVKEVDVPYERKYGTRNLMSWISDKTSFDVYQARFRIRYLMNRGIIANVINQDMDCELGQVTNRDWLFIQLEDLSKNICERLEMGGYANWEDVMWDFILRLTGENRSVEELKKQGTKGEFAKYIMKRYRWFSWTEEEDFDDREYCGIITLQPDGKTFAILRFPVFERDDYDDDDEDSFRGCGYW